ncbi:hypothetical protein FF1_045591 [Malus domestica]|uniref:uncharacterized protein LOC126582247 isoform X1 n=1 Tax=Malus sylvestris TaxID=3752 RepID=UPI0021ABD198|nr:uncharacterized protein LOC126582247 isoform X1 [Malus sylvestris]
MSQSGNESERQSKKQKLLSPDPESLQGHIPDLPPNADELRKRGKLIWHWDDSDDDEFEDFPPGKVYFAIEENYNARMTAKKELSEIRARRSSLKERKNTTEAQTDDKPKTGRWFCLQPHIPPPIYCRICKKSDDHMTKQCPRFDSSTAVRDVRCPLCLREDHVVIICPYRYYVPRGEKVGPGGKLVCICCQKEGGHPGEEWVGKAVGNYCRICSSTYDHRTEDCPVKKGREIVGGKFQSAMVDS